MSADHNWTAQQVQVRLEVFKVWLSKAGAEVLQPTNMWEVARFRDGSDTSIIYKNARDGVTFTGTSLAAWNAFKSGRPWRADVPRVKRKNGKARAQFVLTIRERDGDECFFCARPVSEDEESVEHLIEVTNGGTNHLSNLCLAHTKCNQDAAGLSLAEKIKAYSAARASSGRLPWED